MIVQRKYIFFFLFFTIILVLGYSSRDHLSDVKRLGYNAIDYWKDKSQGAGDVPFATETAISVANDIILTTDQALNIAVTSEHQATSTAETASEHQAFKIADTPSEHQVASTADIPSPTEHHPVGTSHSTTSTEYQVSTDAVDDAHDPTSEHQDVNAVNNVGDIPTSAEHNASDVADNFGSDRWFFQDDLHDYENAKFDLGMKSYRPHNYRGEGHETYATFLSTRNSSLKDPYFLATQQITYRLLWDPRSKSSHPVVVFVAPYISQIQRDYLMAAGAMVRELELIEWQPSHKSKAQPRWREMFSKLNFWKQTDFSRILYLDTDAFPLTHLDELFDIAKEQTCEEEACPYVFTAVEHEWGGLNAGMMVFKPDLAMHTLLMREMHERDYDQNMVEQAFLDHEFDVNGPRPAQYIERKWNALFTTDEDEGKINVIHEKLWAMHDHFAWNYFRETWDAMIELYESEEFVWMREADGID